MEVYSVYRVESDKHERFVMDIEANSLRNAWLGVKSWFIGGVLHIFSKANRDAGKMFMPIRTAEEGMFVTLRSCGNPDLGQDPDQPYMDATVRMVKVETIDEARAKVREYIEKYDLGAGNWTGGQVWDREELVGYVAYNGKFFPYED